MLFCKSKSILLIKAQLIRFVYDRSESPTAIGKTQHSIQQESIRTGFSTDLIGLNITHVNTQWLMGTGFVDLSVDISHHHRAKPRDVNRLMNYSEHFSLISFNTQVQWKLCVILPHLKEKWFKAFSRLCHVHSGKIVEEVGIFFKSRIYFVL